MYCGDQGGIYRVILYENVGLAITRDVNGDIESVLNTGLVIDITECENLTLGFTDKQKPGNNDLTVHEYSITFSLFGFSTAYPQLDQLASIFGFIPVIYFRNDTIKVVTSPIYKNTDVKYNEDKTQVYPLVLTSLVPTFEILQDFADEPVVWVLENGVWGGAETTWTAGGIWNTV